MAQNSIRISADTREFKKDLLDLSKQIQRDLGGKQNIQLFGKEERDFLSQGAKSAIADMKKEADSLKKTNEEITKELKSQNLTTTEQARKQRDLLQNAKKRMEIQKEISEMERVQTQALGRRGGIQEAIGAARGGLARGAQAGRGGAGGGLGGLAYMAPQAARGMGAAGMGMAGMALGGLGAGVGLAGAFGFSRAMAGAQQFEQNAPLNLQLLGRGLRGRRAQGLGGGAQQLNLGPGETMQLQLQAMDILGREGAAPEDVARRKGVALETGVSLQQLQGAGQGLRQQLGREGARKEFLKLQASLIATEMEGAIGPYLETAANMLKQINQEGLGLNTAALTALQQTAEVPGVSPERGARALTGISQQMKQAQGGEAAFFMSALSRQGLGGGTIGGAQMAMQQGLFGGNLQKLKERGLISQDMLEEFQAKGLAPGGKGGPQTGAEMFERKARGITKTFEDLTENMGAVGTGIIAKRLTGAETAGGGLQRMGLLEEAAQAREKGDVDKLKEIKDKLKEQTDPQQAMLDDLDAIKNSSAQILKVSQAFKEGNLQRLGDQVAPAVAKARDVLTNIDKGISGLLEFFGVETAQEARAERQVGRTLKGEVEKEDLKKLTKEQQKAMLEEVKERKGRLKQERYTGGLVPMENLSKKEEQKLSMLRELRDFLARSVENSDEQTKQLKKEKGTAKQGRSARTGKLEKHIRN